jgi:hypothetical protein
MTPTPASQNVSLVRTIASASRKLEKDMDLSPLQAIDRLHKLRDEYKDQWMGPSPWLVLEDCYTLPAQMPVSKMLGEIERHGQPIGIVGMGFLKENHQVVVLQRLFRKDAESRKTVEVSTQAAKSVLWDAMKRIDLLTKGKDKK